MKLLIITQKVDENDPILGFFHRWLEKFAENAESLTVICLEKGVSNLPSHVRVLSLGKEEGGSRIQYLRRLIRYAWRERKHYDGVFVHMNQEYVLAAGMLWKLLRKRIFLWRNHPYGNMLTRMAVALSDRVYCTSTRSYTARFQKTELMPAGIDTELFRPIDRIKRVPHSILCLGRMSRIKRPHLLVSAAESLRRSDVNVKVSIVGDPTEDSIDYYRRIRAEAESLEREGVIRFFEAVMPDVAPELYNAHEIYVNMTESGSFDKTIAEAMACEKLIVISNLSFDRLIPKEYHDLVFFREGSAEDLALKLKGMLALSEGKKREIGKVLRESIIRNQSLDKLMDKLAEELS